MTNPKPRRKPADQTRLGPNKIDANQPPRPENSHISHPPDISQTAIPPQADDIGPADANEKYINYMALADTLRKARLKLHMRQADVGRRLGVKQSAISQWENGKFIPEVKFRFQLAVILQIPLRELMPEDEGLDDTISQEMFYDPRVRRLVANYLALDEAAQQTIDQLIEQWRALKARDR